MSARLLALLALLGVSGGLVLHVFGVDAPAHLGRAATTALLLVPLTVSVTRTLLRHDVGVDAIALVLMAGALARGASLADALIALMLAFGVPFLLSISPTCIDFRFALYGASVFVSVGLWARRRSSDRWSPAGVDGPRRWTPHPHGLTFVGVRSSGGGSIVYGADGVLLPVFPIRACRRW